MCVDYKDYMKELQLKLQNVSTVTSAVASGGNLVLGVLVYIWVGGGYPSLTTQTPSKTRKSNFFLPYFRSNLGNQYPISDQTIFFPFSD